MNEYTHNKHTYNEACLYNSVGFLLGYMCQSTLPIMNYLVEEQVPCLCGSVFVT